ncbi:MAG: dephospho-CoA kinase [Bacteroidetes bacterium]|nr:MAG: dephospho-CoA kinase [Bacteroidota bacterium]
MLRVGITGPIGCGKSYVAGRLVAMGFSVYDADREAKALVARSASLRDDIRSLLGEEAFGEDGAYNRAWVAQRVFSDRSLLEGLNGLIHPAVLADFDRFATEQGEAGFVFMESALLPQIAWRGVLDRVVVVTAPEALREERVQRRDGVDLEQVRARMRSQAGEEAYLRIADATVENDGTGNIDWAIVAALSSLRHAE